MPEVEDECKFDVLANQMQFITAKGGDKIMMKTLSFTAEQAASLAYLINADVTLAVEVKVKE